MTDARHPLDPDPQWSTKATGVYALGVAAALTGALVGGVVPAAVALLLAREAAGDLSGAGGFLLGAQRVRTGVRLAWVGILLAVATLIVGSIIGLLHFAESGGADYAPTVN